jgi:hypothetical protein
MMVKFARDEAKLEGTVFVMPSEVENGDDGEFCRQLRQTVIYW